MKKERSPPLADSIYEPRTRKIKQQFFAPIHTLLDRQHISDIINHHYEKGK